jgi:hypothetical protein
LPLPRPLLRLSGPRESAARIRLAFRCMVCWPSGA